MLTVRLPRLPRRQAGFNLIELMVGIAIFGILMAVALPAFTTFLRNSRIKNAAETTMHGINVARAEAVRRNAPVRFQLVTTLTSACALSSSTLNWVVSLTDPTGACDATPGAGNIVQTKSATEGTEDVVLSTTGGSTVVFNGLGRVTGAGITQMIFSYPGGGACEDAGGPMRCMHIDISTAGAAKICDPKMTITNDPRKCP